MCDDNLVKFLQSVGYNVVRLPREGIEPLQVLFKGNGLDIIGNISDLVLEENLPLPKGKQNLDAAIIKGSKSSEFTVDFGIQLAVGKLLPAMGAKIPGLNSALQVIYKKANTVQYQINDVKFDSVFPATIARYLGKVTPDITSDIVDQLLDMSPSNPAYIITETLQSRSFTITAHDSSGATVKIDVGALEKLIESNSTIKVSVDDKNAVSFEGESLLRFGFKVAPIWIKVENGKARFKLGIPSKPVGPLNFIPISPDLEDQEFLSTVLIGNPGQLLRIRSK